LRIPWPRSCGRAVLAILLMARVAYVARPAATSRYRDAFTAKKSTLTTRYSATARPGVPIRTTGRVMMEFWLSTRGRVTPTARRVWRLFSTSAVESTALVFRLFSSALCTRQVMTVLSLASSEARDPLILSVTRGLLHRSEQVALRQMMRGGVQLAVMPRGVHRVALIARGVGRIRVTRVARHIR
jgi:hypothetical protein